MKKIGKTLGISLLALTLLGQTSCIGSFTLTGKVYNFNKNVGDKFLNEIVFLAFNIVPVYGVAVVVDAVVFNLIEFWTDSNPLALQEGQRKEKIVSKNGETYKFTATSNAVNVEVIDGVNAGKQVEFMFDNSEQVFTMNYQGKSVTLIELNSSEQIATVYYPNGIKKNISINETSINEAIAYAIESGSITALK